MSTYLLVTPTEDELYHHGVKECIGGFVDSSPISRVPKSKAVRKSAKLRRSSSAEVS